MCPNPNCFQNQSTVVDLQGKDVKNGDEFVYNKEFRHRMCRIKINQVQLKETVSVRTSTAWELYVYVL